MDVYRLSGDSFYRHAAETLANYFATRLYKPGIGAIYQTTVAHPNGFYRVDLALEVGCALIQAGTQFRRPDWTGEGQRIVQFVYSHAYVAQYHVLLLQMDNVLLSSGAPNPDETIYRDVFRNFRIEGGSVKLGEVAQEALSLLHVYLVTGDTTYMNRATDLLSSFTAQTNLLGLWDNNHIGYFAGAVFPGPDIAHPGQPRVSGTAKESGRQLQMLEAFRVANSITNNQYQSMQTALLHLALGPAYYRAGHGVLFEMTENWQPLVIRGGVADWVTAEAMGISLESLLSVDSKRPW
jgi:hypothetical protein